MTAPQGFRRSWVSWFACPRCGCRSLFPHAGGRLAAHRRSFKILYWCPNCLGLSERQHPWLHIVVAVALSLVAFILIYRLLLAGLSPAMLVRASAVLIGLHVLNLAIDWLTGDYVPFQDNEP